MIPTALSTMSLVFSGVESLLDLSEHVDRPLHAGKELGLLLGDLTEDFRRLLSLVSKLLSGLACPLGLVSEVLGRLPGAFLDMPKDLGR